MGPMLCATPPRILEQEVTTSRGYWNIRRRTRSAAMEHIMKNPFCTEKSTVSHRHSGAFEGVHVCGLFLKLGERGWRLECVTWEAVEMYCFPGIGRRRKTWVYCVCVIPSFACQASHHDHPSTEYYRKQASWQFKNKWWGLTRTTKQDREPWAR